MELAKPENCHELDFLDISHRGLTQLPSWIGECTNLKTLICHHNNITTFKYINFSNTIEIIDCSYNNLTDLDILPILLLKLICHCNSITSLDNLPLTLIYLKCDSNFIMSLQYLPQNLKFLDCSNNYLFTGKYIKINSDLIKQNTTFHSLVIPGKLKFLNCCGNYIEELNLKFDLLELICDKQTIIKQQYYLLHTIHLHDNRNFTNYQKLLDQSKIMNNTFYYKMISKK